MELRRVAIAGVGMIGATLARAIRQARPGVELIGFDPRPPSPAAGVGMNRWASSAAEACAAADLVILAAPVGGILELLPVAARSCPEQALVTDVGSSKAEVCRAARAAFTSAAGPHFVGGHPMAGSEREGAEAADPAMLRDAPYALCGDPSLPPGKREALQRLVTEMGARPVWIEPADHDRLVAQVSHLPQVVAVALASLLQEAAGKDPRLVSLTAGGLRDMLRVASSPYGIWRDILRSNAGEVRQSIDLLVGRLKEMSARLEDEALGGWFEEGRRFREPRLKGEE